MSNKIQANCNFNNRFNISNIKHLEERLNQKYSELEILDQRIIENEHEFVHIDGIPSKNTYRDSNRKALLRVRSIIFYSYQFNCKEMKRAKRNLTIC